MIESSRFIIGIDLGTTSSAVAYVDTDETKNPNLSVQLFKIPQLIEEGVIKKLPLFPSFHYLVQEGEFAKGSLALPWDVHGERDYVVGAFAKELGSKTPTQIVHSAKSWLSNQSSQRKEAILPLDAADPTRRITPLVAIASFLSHLKEAWNMAMAKANEENAFENQEVIITVPASFDEVARRLTLEAVKMAGLDRSFLIEEPQAAFYSWIIDHEKEKILEVDSHVLVCDVGGGTTDFTLIEVGEDKNNRLTFQRKAVGEHLLLGGDNMDSAIAHFLEKKYAMAFEKREWDLVRFEAHRAKESLLAGLDSAPYSIWLSGAGSQLIGKSRSLEISLEEMEHVLVDGFFGFYSFEEALQLKKAGGLRKMGLNFESEPSITKHLASFLQKNQICQRPAYLLFNGGAMQPMAFRNRIKENLENWYSDTFSKLEVLTSANLELAVARGAAYFGKARRGMGVKIGGGIARNIYLGIDVKLPTSEICHKGLTLLSKGTEQGLEIASSHQFDLLPNRPVSFQLYHSCTRKPDTPGSMVEILPEEMGALPPLQTVLRFGKRQDLIPVTMVVGIDETGILRLWLASVKTDHRWNLEFQLNQNRLESKVIDETFDAAFLEKGKTILQKSFNGEKETKLMQELEEFIASPRREFPPTVLRNFFDALIEIANKRKLSCEYASRFWNAAGYFLRPGCGYPLDDYRIKKLWKVILEEKHISHRSQVLIQKWICYRRVSAGLSKGQQTELFNEIFPTLSTKSKKNNGEYLFAEKVRSLAALELVDLRMKEKLGDLIMHRLQAGQAKSADFWALARLGARELLYGAVGNILPVKAVTPWIESLLKANPNKKDPHVCFALACLSKKSDVREVNLPKELFEDVRVYLQEVGEEKDLMSFLAGDKQLSLLMEQRLFGDHLPCALSISEAVS